MPAREGLPRLRDGGLQARVGIRRLRLGLRRPDLGRREGRGQVGGEPNFWNCEIFVFDLVYVCFCPDELSFLLIIVFLMFV